MQRVPGTGRNNSRNRRGQLARPRHAAEIPANPIIWQDETAKVQRLQNQRLRPLFVVRSPIHWCFSLAEQMAQSDRGCNACRGRAGTILATEGDNWPVPGTLRRYPPNPIIWQDETAKVQRLQNQRLRPLFVVRSPIHWCFSLAEQMAQSDRGCNACRGRAGTILEIEGDNWPVPGTLRRYPPNPIIWQDETV